jgi:hypothetical protein
MISLSVYQIIALGLLVFGVVYFGMMIMALMVAASRQGASPDTLQFSGMYRGAGGAGGG